MAILFLYAALLMGLLFRHLQLFQLLDVLAFLISFLFPLLLVFFFLPYNYALQNPTNRKKPKYLHCLKRDDSLLAGAIVHIEWIYFRWCITQKQIEKKRKDSFLVAGVISVAIFGSRFLCVCVCDFSFSPLPIHLYKPIWDDVGASRI